MTFDPKCYELAKTFLADHPTINIERNIDELAGIIQTEIDDWIERREIRAADQEGRGGW
jgi:hypothetical protein